MPKNDRSNRAQHAARIDETYRLLLAGADRQSVFRFASAKGWNVTERQVENYIAAANQLIEAQSEFERAREFGRSVLQLNDLYSRSMKVQDHKTALAVRKELNALYALHLAPAARTTNLNLTGITQAQLDTLTAALESHGLTASDVFAALMSRLAEESHDRP